jgi:hypothetical protein
LEQVVRDIADVVCERSAKGRNFGTVLIPEGLLISLPKIKPFYEELQELVDDSCGNDKAKKNEFVLKLQRDKEFRHEKMSPWSYALFNTLPEFTQEQIL